MKDQGSNPLFPRDPLGSHEKYTETLTIRMTKQDLALLQRICKARGEDVSGFLRRAMRVEFAKLGFLTEEERQALGIHESQMESSQLERERLDR